MGPRPVPPSKPVALPTPPISVFYAPAGAAPEPIHPDWRLRDLASDPQLLDALFDIFREMQYAETDLDALLKVVVRKVVETVGVDLAWATVADLATSEDRSGAVWGNRIEGFSGLAQIEGLGQACIQLARTVVAIGYLDHPELGASGARQRLSQEQVGTLIATPMVADGAAVGVLYAATRDSTVPNERACWLLSLIAAQASVAVSNGRLLHVIDDQRKVLELTLDAHNRIASANLDGADLDVTCRQIADVLGCAVSVHADLEATASAWGVVEGQDSTPTRTLPLLDGDEPLGELRLFGHIEAEREGVLWYAASAVTVELLRRRAAIEAERMMQDELLSHLIDGDDAREPRLAQRAARLQVDLNAARSVLVLSSDVREPSEVLSAARQRLREFAEESTGPALIGLRDGRVTVVLPPGSCDGFVHSVAGCVDGVRAGLSRPSVQLRNAYDEALAAWQIAAHAPHSDVVIDVAMLGELRFLLDVGDLAPLCDQLRIKLGPVIDQDSRGRVPLLETLTAFVQEGGRYSPAAARCRVHPNTLKHRLARVSELLGISLRDRNTLFALRLELQVLGFLDQLGYDTSASERWRTGLSELVVSRRDRGSIPRASSTVSS